MTTRRNACDGLTWLAPFWPSSVSSSPCPGFTLFHCLPTLGRAYGRGKWGGRQQPYCLWLPEIPGGAQVLLSNTAIIPPIPPCLGFTMSLLVSPKMPLRKLTRAAVTGPRLLLAPPALAVQPSSQPVQPASHRPRRDRPAHRLVPQGQEGSRRRHLRSHLERLGLRYDPHAHRRLPIGQPRLVRGRPRRWGLHRLPTWPRLSSCRPHWGCSQLRFSASTPHKSSSQAP